MQILFAAPFGLGEKTTVWARTLPLAQHAVARGHGATIVIPPWDTPVDAGVHTTDSGVDLINVRLDGGLVAITRRMLQEIAQRRPDIVHVVKPRAHAGLVQWWLWHRRRLGHDTPALLLDMDDWEQAWNEINDYGPIVGRFLAFQEEWGIRHADGITVASRWLEARADAYAPTTPILYLPNGVTPPDGADGDTSAATQARNPGDAPVVLYYSRFVEVPPEWLARCWETVLAQFRQARLVVAGTPLQPGRDAHFRATMEAALGDRAATIDWLGFVSPATQAQLYADADCAIFPAMAVPLQQAKCSVRLATTLLHGVPVVASAVGEQTAYGGGGAAQLVPADASPVQFGRAVNALLADPAARAEMTTQAAARLSSTFNWASLGDDLLAFYQAILARKRQGRAEVGTHGSGMGG